MTTVSVYGGVWPCVYGVYGMLFYDSYMFSLHNKYETPRLQKLSHSTPDGRMGTMIQWATNNVMNETNSVLLSIE